MPQYLLLAMSFTNVLNVYAFCNLHDVSWGTKGSDTVDALPEVSSKKVKSKADDNRATAIVEDTYRTQQDLDAVFNETLQRAVTPLEENYRTDKPTLDDQNKTFRTRLVSFWMLTNAGLAVAVENLNGLASDNPSADEAALRKRQNVYFSIILYSTAGLAVVRFAGVSHTSRPVL